MIASAKMLTSSAVLMRMDGFALPVMAIAGSGNQGIAALVPIMAVAEAIGAGKDMIIRAAALSSLITIYIKERTGITSPICGGSIAGGAGASAGIAYLIGGDKVVITNAVTNAIGGLAGMICDGAKSGCAFKLSISAGTAVEAAIMSMSGAVIPSNNGIVGADLNQTIENLAQVTNAGMESVDDIMIEIMTSRNNQTSKTFQFK
jgi:L-cysteine desulfidase